MMRRQQTSNNRNDTLSEERKVMFQWFFCVVIYVAQYLIFYAYRKKNVPQSLIDESPLGHTKSEISIIITTFTQNG